MAEPSLIHGHSHLYSSNPARFLIDEKFRQMFGKVYGYFAGDEPCLVVTEPELLRKIFLENPQAFTERRKIIVKTSFSKGILFCEHDRWRLMRGLMSPYFSSFFVRSDSSANFIETSIKYLIEYIELKRQAAIKENKRVEIDIHSLMKSTTLHMISAIAVQLPNVQIKEGEPNVENLDKVMSASENGFFNYISTFPFLAKAIIFLSGREDILRKFHRIFDNLIDSKTKQLAASNQKRYSHLIDELIKAFHQGKLSRTELMACVDSLLLAGYDTTSTALTNLLWTLGKNLEIQDKLRKELEAYGTESEYLVQVINETLRLYPPVINFTTRLATKTIKIDNLTIPQGVKVIYNARLMHRDPDLWNEPEKFDPERFSKGKVIHPCAFAPFGLGERKCIGYQLSLLEMRMIICDLVLRFKMITITPDVLEFKSRSFSLAEPTEKVRIEFQKL